MEADGRSGWMDARWVGDGTLEIGLLNGEAGERWDLRCTRTPTAETAASDSF